MPEFPYWRLSGFYFFYFALLGSYIPFWALYLQDEGYSATEIGYLTGVVMATKVVAPSLWGWLADHSGQRLRVVRLGSLLACICFCGIFVSTGFAGLLLVVIGYSFFWNAVLPQFEVITLAHLGRQYSRYSQVRVWGSVGFIVAVVVLGIAFDHLSIAALPFVMTSLLAAIWLCSLFIRELPRPHEHTSSAGVLAVLRRRHVAGFLLVCFLMQVAHGPYYTFFTLYLEQLDYSRALAGQMWALGVAAEVMLFLLMHRLLPRYGARNLLLISVSLSILRWLLIAYLAHRLPLLLLAQVLHAGTFGAVHAVSIELVRRAFPSNLAGQGQAIYGGISFGAGGAIGAVASGYLWEYSAQLTFVMASVVSAVALLLAWYCVATTDAEGEAGEVQKR